MGIYVLPDLELNKNTKSDIIKEFWINTPVTLKY